MPRLQNQLRWMTLKIPRKRNIQISISTFKALQLIYIGVQRAEQVKQLVLYQFDKSWIHYLHLKQHES